MQPQAVVVAAAHGSRGHAPVLYRRPHTNRPLRGQGIVMWSHGTVVRPCANAAKMGFSE